MRGCVDARKNETNEINEINEINAKNAGDGQGEMGDWRYRLVGRPQP
jgi:hypothetical protein